MSTFRLIKWLSALLILLPFGCFAYDDSIIDHHKIIHVDPSLTFSQVITYTLEKFPEYILASAREQEADALQQRGNSWLAGAASVALKYQDNFPTEDIGSREMETAINLPLWNWGQRAAVQAVADQAVNSSLKQSIALQLKVTGFIRHALWNLTLEEIRHDHSQSILKISEKLLEKIQRRVDLGDLPRSDLLLAKTDHLQKRVLLTQAEAKMTLAAENYISLTQLTKIPSHFKEQQSSLTSIPENHPQLLAINAVINRKQANLNSIKSIGSGQSSLSLGGKSEKGSENEDDVESLSIEITIPFGGSAHLAPKVARTNINLSKSLVQRAYLLRLLEKQLQQAKYALEVSQAELAIANELKQIAQTHLKITRLNFSAGEINLMELLKIQTRFNNAIRHAKEQNTLQQKYISIYNQSVGALPIIKK